MAVYRLIFIAFVILAAALFSLIKPAPSFSQEENSIERTARYELLVFGKTKTNTSLLNRVRALELEVFGRLHKAWDLPETLDQIGHMLEQSDRSKDGASSAVEEGAKEYRAKEDDTSPMIEQVKTTKQDNADLLAEALRNYKQGKLDVAADQFQQVLSVEPANADAIYNLGALSEKRGDLRDALRYYAMGLRANPGDSELKAAYDEVSESLRSRTVTGGEEKMQSSEGAKLIAEASSAFKNRDYNTAINALARLLQDTPDDPKAQFAMGQSLRAIGRDAEASVHFRRAAALDPSNDLYSSTQNSIDERVRTANNGTNAGSYPQRTGEIVPIEGEPGEDLYRIVHGVKVPLLSQAIFAATAFAMTNPKFARYGGAISMLNMFANSLVRGF